MKTGRDDLDAMLKVSSIPADEPTFLLRAQDAQAAETVRAWAELQLTAGAPVAVVEQALRQADAMDAWPVKKTPGADHLTEAESKQLAYAYDRRRWNLGSRDVSALAEARGFLRAAQQRAAMVSFVKIIAGLETGEVTSSRDRVTLLSMISAARSLVEAGPSE